MDYNFIEQIFSNEPCPPCSFEILSDRPADALGEILKFGAKFKYGKSLEMLNSDEMSKMRDYIRSIGFDVNYVTETKYKTVVDYTELGDPYIRRIPWNLQKITFPTFLDPNNRPEFIN